MTPTEQVARSIGIVLMSLALVSSGCGGDAGPGEIARDDLKGRIEAGQAPVVLDVRSPEEYASGHVPGAINIPHDQLGLRLAEISPDREAAVVVYCESGRRAAAAAGILSEAGFTDLRHLTGDMSGWREADLTVER